MRPWTFAFSRASVTEIDTPLLVVNLFEGVTQPSGATGAVDAALGGQISRLIADGEITGEPATITVIHNARQQAALKARRVAVVGLGKRRAEFDSLENVRVGAGARRAQGARPKLDSFATIVHGAGSGGLDPDDAARATIESLDPGAVSLRTVQRSHEVQAPGRQR